MAIIALEGLEFYAYHGVFPKEQIFGTNFQVDIYIEFDIEAAGKTDEVSQTVDYQEVFALIEEIMKNNVKLLETLVIQICEQVLSLNQDIKSVKTRVSKYNLPISIKHKRSFVEHISVRN